MENYNVKLRLRLHQKWETSEGSSVMTNAEQYKNDDPNLSSDFKLDEFKTNKRHPKANIDDRKTKRAKISRTSEDKINVTGKDKKSTLKSTNLDEKELNTVEETDISTNVNEATSNDEDGKTCPSCCKTINAATSASHIIWCIKRFDRLNKKTVKKHVSSIDAACPICHKDLSKMAPSLREQHTNRCIDTSQESDSTQNFESFNGDRTRPPLTDCPFCGRIGHSPKWRLKHMKKCAKERGISTEMLLEAKKLQERQAEEWEAAGLAVPSVIVPRRQAQRRNRQVTRQNEPQTALQADIQMAMAISLSLQENEQKKLDEKQHLIDVLNSEAESQKKELEKALGSGDSAKKPLAPKGRKNKAQKNETIPLLLLRTPEECAKIVAERLDLIVSKNMIDSDEEECPLIVNWKKLKENLPIPKSFQGGSRLWNVASLAEDVVSDSKSFYVQNLSSYFTPSKVKPGSNLKHLSQIPGYQTLSNVSLPATQEILDINEDVTNFHKDSHHIEDGDNLPSTLAILEELHAKNSSPPVSVVHNSPLREDLTSNHKVDQLLGVSGFCLDGSYGDGFLSQIQQRDENNHKECLAHSLLKMVANKTLSDVNIIVNDGSRIPCHQFMLYTRCPQAYQELVKNHKSGSEVDVLQWSFVTYQTAIAFLEFVYCGSIFAPFDKEEIGLLAKRYHMDDLTSIISKGSSTEISNNFSEIAMEDENEKTSNASGRKQDFNAAFIRSDSNVLLNSGYETCEASTSGSNSKQDIDKDLQMDEVGLPNPMSATASDMCNLSIENCSLSTSKAKLLDNILSEMPSPVFKSEKPTDNSPMKKYVVDSHKRVSPVVTNTITPKDSYKTATVRSMKRINRSLKEELDAAATPFKSLVISPAVIQSQHPSRWSKMSVSAHCCHRALSDASVSTMSPELFIGKGYRSDVDADLTSDLYLLGNEPNLAYEDPIKDDCKFATDAMSSTSSVIKSEITKFKPSVVSPKLSSKTKAAGLDCNAWASTPLEKHVKNTCLTSPSPKKQLSILTLAKASNSLSAEKPASPPEKHKCKHKTSSQASPLCIPILKFLSPEDIFCPAKKYSSETALAIDNENEEQKMEESWRNSSLLSVNDDCNNHLDIWENFNDDFHTNFSSQATLPTTPMSSKSYKSQGRISSRMKLSTHTLVNSSLEDELPDLDPPLLENFQIGDVKNSSFISDEVVDRELQDGKIVQKVSPMCIKVASKKKSSAQPKKKSLKSKAGVTPLPHYSIMPTPDIKKELQKIGVRPLPKKKAVNFLKHVYKETHPNADTDNVASQMNMESPVSHSSQVSSLQPRRLLNSVQGKQSRAKEHVVQEQRTNFNDFIKRNESLYLKVLQYEPIEIISLHLGLKSEGVNITLGELKILLDDEGITYTSNQGNSPRKKRVKRRIKK